MQYLPLQICALFVLPEEPEMLRVDISSMHTLDTVDTREELSVRHAALWITSRRVDANMYSLSRWRTIMVKLSEQLILSEQKNRYTRKSHKT
jgi:hypothetical protein